MKSCLRIIIISLTLAHSHFHATFLVVLVGYLSDRSTVTRRRCGGFPHLTYPSVLYVQKTVRIASGLSFFRQDIFILGAIADAGWKQSSLKCLSHKKLCLDGPFHSNDREFSLLSTSTAPYGGHRSGFFKS